MSGTAPTRGVDLADPVASVRVGEEPIAIYPVETWLAPTYFLLYMAYLFWRPEDEALHWVSLVLIPVLLVMYLKRRTPRTVASTLASFGLRRGNLTRGLGFTLVLGTGLGLFQLFFSRSGPAALEAFASGRALYLFPLAFILMLLTAGFTEEVFFRGFLQTRMEALLGSKWSGLIVTSLFFGLYHLPYAYFNPNWPSAGDWGAAWGSALGQGVPGGLVLGGVYLYSRKNLLACIILHSLINAFPGMGMIRFSGP
jgi:membrane protease YdiL (CAAX protease family)